MIGQGRRVVWWCGVVWWRTGERGEGGGYRRPMTLRAQHLTQSATIQHNTAVNTMTNMWTSNPVYTSQLRLGNGGHGGGGSGAKSQCTPP